MRKTRYQEHIKNQKSEERIPKENLKAANRGLSPTRTLKI